MAGGQRARDLEGLIGANQRLTAQCPADQLDHRLGQVGDIADGLVFDLAVLAVAMAQQVGDVLAMLALAPVGDDVNGAGLAGGPSHGRGSTAPRGWYGAQYW